MMGDPQLDTIARALAAGEEIDWEAAVGGATGADTAAALRELRILEGIASFHRSSVPPPRHAGISKPPPDQWGELRIIRRIAAGSFGDVYEAYNPALARVVALKLIVSGEEVDSTRDGVISEAQLLARVRHPNVVTVYGAARFDGRTGIWMELVRGRTLAEQFAASGPMSAPDAARIARDLCAALAAVHAAGLVHRDVKAQNVIVEDGGRVVLIDLGAGFDPAIDAAPLLAGTPAYAAPEVLRGEPATPRSDLYGLGVLLQYLTTGTFPVGGASVSSMRADHDAGRRTPLPTGRFKLPRPFVSIVARALSPDASQRFDSAEAMGRALERVVSARATRRLGLVIGLGIAAVVGIGARPWIPSRPSTLASMVETLVRSVPARGRSDLAGSWNDTWTEGLCGYACGTQPGHGGTTTLTVTSDSETTFHGTYGVFPITGTVTDSSISFAWKNYPTWAGIAQGGCKGTVSAKSMWLTCSALIAPPSGGLLLNGTNNDQLTKATPSGLAITSVLDPPSYLNVGQPIHSFTVRVVYMNRGNSSSTTALAEFFLSGSGSTRDVFLGNAALPALSSYDVGSVTSLVGADRMPPLGKYFLLACIGTECRRGTGQVLVGGSNRHKTNDAER